MRNRTLPAAALVWMVLLCSPLPAATEIVLQDGQTIRGQDLQREGDVYLVKLEGDGVLTVPVALVKQVRWVNDDERAHPSADGLIQRSEATQLAGENVQPVTPEQALANLPDPARFRPSLVDPNWEPTSGFGDADVLAPSRSTFQAGVVDPLWKPTSGFSDADVLASGRSIFRRSPIDPSWRPEDGFAKRDLFWGSDTSRAQDTASDPLARAVDLAPSRSPTAADANWRRLLEKGGWIRSASLDELGTGTNFRFEPPPAPGTPRMSARARACGERSLRAADEASRSANVKVGHLDDPLYEELPLELYEAIADTTDGTRRTVFTVDGDGCRVLGGDLQDVMGVKLSDALRLSSSVASYNAALGNRVRVELPTERAKLDYALAIVAVTDSQVSGERRAKMLLVEEAEAFDELHAREPESCSESKSSRRRAWKSAQRKFVVPRVVRTSRGETAEFMTWSSVDGEVVKFAVDLADDGKVSISHERVASHLGDHTDRESPVRP